MSTSQGPFWRDPLFTFLIVGGLIFLAASLLNTDKASYTINISDADLQRINDQWVMQMRRPPTEAELTGLVREFVKEEIYYREAKRLGLDANDTIVRRRLVQKLTFLTEDVATASQPTDAMLQAYYQEHIDEYRVPTRYSFSHRYFSVDRRSDAQGDAVNALTDLAQEGDPFMLQRSYAARSEREIANQFGKEFGNELAQLGKVWLETADASAAQQTNSPDPSQAWLGPIKSAYGWHTILLTDVETEHVQPFDAVLNRVSADFKQAQREQANRQYYESKLADYEITFPPSAAMTGES